VIPTSRGDFNAFWGRITKYRTVTRCVHGRDFSILVENTRKGCVHACTVDDLFHMLPFIPHGDLLGIDFLVLRQPKRKEEILASCWGRLAYRVEIGDFAGPTIVLEAVDHIRPLRWDKSLTPDAAAELERLREDGHSVITTKREHVVELTVDSVRSTQLFRTVFHEVGHWVDYVETVERPVSVAPDPSEAYSVYSKRYDSKPKAEKETFAHRYAERLRKELVEQKRIPFARKLDLRSLKRDGLREGDFRVRQGGRRGDPC
jgi:hypothetical protein